ncbi:hypothetical protein [Sporosarcina koreensis]|uniref:ABC-2 family transporter protein n=1 Tax=Sporosarcina koreensis TaxID=334735 RepID=A0ABW0TS51_9BACL
MTGWNGLLRKEWVSLKYSVVIFVVIFIGLAVSSFTPAAVGGIVDSNELDHFFTTILMFSGIALFLHSLQVDLKRPDVWLHSPAPIWKLLFAKMAMALLVVMGLVLIWGGIGVVAYFIGGFAGFVPGVITVQKLLVSSIFMMTASMLIWVIYKVIEIRLGWLAAILSLIPIFVFGMVIWGFLTVVLKTMEPLASTFIYLAVSFVLFASGAILLEKKVRY